MELSRLIALMKSIGCHKIYIKSLSANDNRKQQIYFGGNFSTINLIPFKEIKPDPAKPDRYKAALDFSWLGEDGNIYWAPHAQLILYPQYPEVRFSGFLRGCPKAPSELMNEKQRLAGRILFLGIHPQGNIIGYACHPDNPIVHEVVDRGELPSKGVFKELNIDGHPDDNETRLLTELKRIHREGWLRSKRLGSNGQELPCEAPNCGGLTLEAELGIRPNSNSEPDIFGYEIKQHHVARLSHIDSGILTLMTPEPTGGYYKKKGVEAFIRKYGYPDLTGQKGREDRLNFGGIHKVDCYHERTGLCITLQGFDKENNRICDAAGGIKLVKHDGEEAAVWHYTEIMKHWNRKHAKAAYIPSMTRKTPALEYKYGNLVRLGTGTDFLLYLKAMSEGKIYYDPGIKLENASTKPKPKQRSQFRIRSVNLPALYHEMRTVDLLNFQGK